MTTLKVREVSMLRGIIRDDAKVLHAEVDNHAANLRQEAREAITAEYDANIRAAKRRTEAGVKKAQKFQQDMRGLQREIEQQYGVKLDATRNYSGGGDCFVSIGWTVSLKHAERDKRIEKATREIDRHQREAKLKIDRAERDLVRQVSIAGLESEEAHALLARLPTLASLMPASPKELHA